MPCPYLVVKSHDVAIIWWVARSSYGTWCITWALYYFLEAGVAYVFWLWGGNPQQRIHPNHCNSIPPKFNTNPYCTYPNPIPKFFPPHFIIYRPLKAIPLIFYQVVTTSPSLNTPTPTGNLRENSMGHFNCRSSWTFISWFFGDPKVVNSRERLVTTMFFKQLDWRF